SPRWCSGALRSWSPPGSAVPGQQVVGGGRAPAARTVLLWPPLALPELLDRVKYLPAQFHLTVSGEERRVTQQHIEDEPFVGLWARLGERVPVPEVHGDVPHLHACTRNLGAKPDGHAFVRLHPDDQGVLPEG